MGVRVARGLMHPVVSAPRQGLVSDISFVDCRFTREPASPERYPNGGNVGFAECQRFTNDMPDANVKNIRRTRTTLACLRPSRRKGASGNIW